MPIGLEDRQRGLAQEVELAELMRNTGQCPIGAKIALGRDI